MRQTHVAGDKAFVDFSGKKIPIIDPITGAVREAEIFVAVLGASNLTYAEATWTQGLPDWIGAHVRMFRFWGTRPRLLVPDNLRSGVHKASFYDPEINRSYGTMAAHYGVGILPARPYHPKDKAKVEAGVGSMARRRRSPRTVHRSCTPTSAVPATIIEENDVATTSNDRPIARPRPGGHGQEPARAGGQS
jgi:transposase